jgi:phage-related protein
VARNKAINVILNLKDKFSRPVQRSAAEVRKFERDVKRMENNMRKSFSNLGSHMSKTAADFKNKAAGMSKVAAGIGIGAAVAGIGTGLKEGMDYETYRVQLNTATKDTQKAAKLMKNAIKFANKTPFETGAIVQATSSFEAMGVSSQKWLSITADMAGSTGKDVQQATEAVIDALKSGEFERLKEFGLSKNTLESLDKAGEVFDKKGSVINQAKLAELLFKEMDTRYKGGADALSKTTKGMWSTITGVGKNGLASMVGIMDDGTVRIGSVMDKVRGYIQKVADTFVKWQSDGTLQKISAQIDQGMTIAMTVIGRVLKVAGELWDVLGKYLTGDFVGHFKTVAPILLGIVTAMKLWTLGVKIHELWTKKAIIAQAAMNLVASINPWSIVLMAVIAALMWIVVNFKTVVAWCQTFATAFMTSFNAAKAYVMQLWQAFQAAFPMIANTVTGITNGIKTAFQGIITFFTGVFTGNWSKAFEGLKQIAAGHIEVIKNLLMQPFRVFATGFNFLVSKVNGLKFTVPDWVPNIGGQEFGLNIPSIPNFATGTQYHRGGLARINEGGRGEVVDLPNGAKVIPADKSKKAANGGVTVTVPITIQGNVYGDNDLVERVGGMIASRVKMAIGNV